ncbi:MAG: class I SAM-dependent DNA methyltransferase [Phycisphaerales bacterium JB039]
MPDTTRLQNLHTASLDEAREAIEIAVPPPSECMEQDEEWFVARVGNRWRRFRLHDYGEVFAIPGLYERVVYDAFKTSSPGKIRDALVRQLETEDASPEDLVVLDLGAGNGCVAEELAKSGVRSFIGADICPEAEEAARRDRPGLYDDYIVDDMADLSPQSERKLQRYDFNCLTCVAALGFGDIPPEAFAAAYNLVADGGWVAFTIKSDFVDEGDPSGFSTLLRRMKRDGIMDVRTHEPYRHRLSTAGAPLEYHAYVGVKRADVPGDMLADI